MNIAVVLVTYNRAELLGQAIDGILAQTRRPQRLIVINNCSTDTTQDLVRGRQANAPIPIQLVNLPSNIGGAGGFYEGMTLAYSEGFDAFWIMDDDTVPESDALEALERDFVGASERLGTTPGFVCSTVLWKNDDLCVMNIPAPAPDWPRFLSRSDGFALVSSCSYVSVLIPRISLEQAGLPVPEFFIWFDDVEHTRRIVRKMGPGVLSIRSRVHHWLAVNEGVDFARVTAASAWKYRYGMRNEGAVLLREYGFRHYMAFARIQLGKVFRSGCPRSVKWAMIRACVEALYFRYTIRFPSDLP